MASNLRFQDDSEKSLPEKGDLESVTVSTVAHANQGAQVDAIFGELGENAPK